LLLQPPVAAAEYLIQFNSESFFFVDVFINGMFCLQVLR
jgi:hypothetical protein